MWGYLPSVIEEEAPQWKQPGIDGDEGEDSDSDDSNDESLDVRLSGLLRLHDNLRQFASLMRLLGNNDSEEEGAGGGEVRHLGVTCDGCKKGIVGACFKCG